MTKEFTMNELAEITNISTNQLRMFTGHFTLSKYVIRTYKYKSHPRTGVKFTKEFVTDFIEYLNTVKKRGFKEERTKFIKRQLERVLNA